MKIEMKTTGLNKLMADLEKATKLEAVQETVKHYTAEVQRQSARNSPVITGFLKRSIILELLDDGLTGHVVAEAEYAPIVELGSRYRKAKPFMRSAHNSVVPQFIAELRKIKAIK